MAGIIMMPPDQRQIALDQAAQNWGQSVANRQQQANQSDAIANAVNLYKQAYAPVQQQNQSNLSNYNNLTDLTAQLAQLKNQWNPNNPPEVNQQIVDQANAVRDKLKSIPGVPQGLGTEGLQQFQQNAQPVIESAYQNAITPVGIAPDVLLKSAVDIAKASHNAITPEQALSLGNTITAGYSQQNQDQIKRLQAKHDQIIVSHLQGQFGDALKNKDYGTAAKIGMALEQYKIKTPEWISKMIEQPMSPYQTGMLAVAQERNQIAANRPVGSGRSGTGTGRATGGLTYAQQRTNDTAMNNAQAIMAAYDSNGQLDPVSGEYKPYTIPQQIAFNKASQYINSHGGGNYATASPNQDNIPIEQTGQQSNDAQAWNDRYQNVLQDIQNSNSDDERQQKVNYYEQNGELQQFRDSGLNPDNDIAYIGGANQGEQQQVPQEQQGQPQDQQSPLEDNSQDDAAYNDYLNS